AARCRARRRRRRRRRTSGDKHCRGSPMTTASPDTLRVLIADDHVIFRDGLRALLAATPDTELVGEAATGDEAVTLAPTLQPDVVLMDLEMPGLNGIDDTRRIAPVSPHINALI